MGMGGGMGIGSMPSYSGYNSNRIKYDIRCGNALHYIHQGNIRRNQRIFTFL